MPANTPGGLPYPLPTEPVAEGAAAIRALAEAIDALNPSAHVHFSGNTSIPTGTGGAFLLFDTVDFDPAGMKAAGAVSRLTCKRAGVYVIGANIDWEVVAQGNVRALGLRVNGLTHISQNLVHPGPSGYVRQSTTALWKFAVNDYVEVFVWHDRPGNPLGVIRTANFSPEFWMARVGHVPAGVEMKPAPDEPYIETYPEPEAPA